MRSFIYFLLVMAFLGNSFVHAAESADQTVKQALYCACGRSFSSSDYLARHFLGTTCNEKTQAFPCFNDGCSKHYTTPKGLERHQKIAHQMPKEAKRKAYEDNEEKEVIDEGERFPIQSFSQDNQNLRSKSQQFPSSGLTSRMALPSVVSAPSINFPLSCPYVGCGRLIANSRVLDLHRNGIHTIAARREAEIYRHYCLHCSEHIGSPGDLQYHARNVCIYPAQKQDGTCMECVVCEKAMGSKDVVKAHYRGEHEVGFYKDGPMGDMHYCARCKKAVVDVYEISQHGEGLCSSSSKDSPLLLSSRKMNPAPQGRSSLYKVTSVPDLAHLQQSRACGESETSSYAASFTGQNLSSSGRVSMQNTIFPAVVAAAAAVGPLNPDEQHRVNGENGLQRLRQEDVLAALEQIEKNHYPHANRTPS